ncbi:MAG: hypothetical protein EPO36_12405 [Chloroflexota bacterium]|nr:MAG: hypothetical protein EPO36_12405 [Chloroflexota bacterium]
MSWTDPQEPSTSAAGAEVPTPADLDLGDDRTIPPAAAGPGSAPGEPSRRRSTLGRWVLIGVVIVVVSAVSAYLRRPEPVTQLGMDMFARIPSEQRDALTDDLRAAVGGRFDAMSTSEARTEVAALVQAGFARLDDARLARHLDLLVTAIFRAKEATCASFGRSSLGGTAVDEAVVLDLVNALETADLEEWYRLSVDAIAAEMAGEPPARTVSDAEVELALQPVYESWTVAEQEVVAVVIANLATASDADVCRAVRLAYDGTNLVPEADQAIISLYDMQAAPRR